MKRLTFLTFVSGGNGRNRYRVSGTFELVFEESWSSV